MQRKGNSQNEDILEDQLEEYEDYYFYRTYNFLKCHANISVTTRGLGFIVYSVFKKIIPQPPLPRLYQLYRISLAQFHRRIPLEGLCYPFFINTDLAPQFTFGPIANIINSVGKFSIAGQNFTTVLPKLTVPHPLGISIANLRDTVVALSDPKKSSQEIRKHFYDHNSIPGAVWSEKPGITNTGKQNVDNDWPLLMNADDIMPEKDINALLADDARVLWELENAIIQRKSYEKVKLNYEKEGNASFLTSCYMQNLRIPGCSIQEREQVLPQITGERVEFWLSHPISEDALIMGALNLLGEIEEGENHSLESWAQARSPMAATIKVSYNWQDIALSMIW